MPRDHKGIAYHEGERRPAIDHKANPSSPDPRWAVCTDCGYQVHYVRRAARPGWVLAAHRRRARAIPVLVEERTHCD